MATGYSRIGAELIPYEIPDAPEPVKAKRGRKPKPDPEPEPLPGPVDIADPVE